MLGRLTAGRKSAAGVCDRVCDTAAQDVKHLFAVQREQLAQITDADLLITYILISCEFF
jgi:hypothetical protein